MSLSSFLKMMTSEGSTGTNVQTGEGPPHAEFGAPGDFYVDARKGFGDLYGPKTKEGWPAKGLVMVGPLLDDKIVEGK